MHLQQPSLYHPKDRRYSSYWIFISRRTRKSYIKFSQATAEILSPRTFKIAISLSFALAIAYLRKSDSFPKRTSMGIVR